MDNPAPSSANIPVALLTQALEELRASRGGSAAMRRAAIRYLRNGLAEGHQLGQLIQWLFGWPTPHDSPAVKSGTALDLLDLIKKLTLQDIQTEDLAVDYQPAATNRPGWNSDMVAGDPATEAHARVIWGDSEASVRDFLVKHGASKALADEEVRQFAKERNKEIRKRAIWNVLLGAGLLALSGSIEAVAWFSHQPVLPKNRVNGLLVLAGLYGLVKLVNGIIDLIRPQSNQDSLTES